MRVIAGSAGGLQLKAVPGRDTRPTTDRVKESVFGILDSLLAGCTVLDLFAGTGGLGIEALSRGAVRAVFVDNGRQAIEVVKANLSSTRLAGQARVLRLDSLRALAVLADESGEDFDLIFLDPPYGKGLAAAALSRLAEWPRLAADAVVVCEHANHDEIASSYGPLAAKRHERYGETVVTFFVGGQEAGLN